MLSALSLPVALVATAGGASAARVSAMGGPRAGAVTSSSLGTFTPTFTGPAATGCATAGCDLLTGPFLSPSTQSLASRHSAAAPRQVRSSTTEPRPRTLPLLAPRRSGTTSRALAAADPVVLPSVSCQPMGPGCDGVSSSAGGATGVRGLNAADSGTLSTNLQGDIEPPDQGLCAGNGYVVEANNIGEVMVFDQRLNRLSAPISLETLMGLTGRGWSSGGDPSCVFDHSNGGHWFFTEIASASSEANGGAFSGCFAGVANECYEAIAVTVGSNPFGPYNVYFANADYNPAEPGSPTLLNDFAKIATSRDAFELFYDEFPLVTPGIGGGFFNGAQEIALDKNAMEAGAPVTEPDGSPNLNFNVAVENMGLIPTPDGTCTSDNTFHQPGITCWFSVIPVQPPDASQFDNSHGGSGFMMGTLDYYGNGDNRLAVFDWTGLGGLNSHNCASCANIQFGGQLFSNADFYFGEGQHATQKAGPIPLGDECGAAGLSTATSCPEGGIATNGDNITQASQASGQLLGSATTEVSQTFSSESAPEVHQGVVYWAVGTNSFDRHGVFTLDSESYVSAAHEDLTMPAIAGEGLPFQDGGNGRAIIMFTLTGNGGPTGADGGGFFPSTAYGRVSPFGGLSGSVIHVADLGQAPDDGFGEYLGFPGNTRPRWGDYSQGVFVPGTGRIFFANNYIQFPNCSDASFTLTIPTCGGTRDGFANWGTSVNSVVP